MDLLLIMVTTLAWMLSRCPYVTMADANHLNHKYLDLGAFHLAANTQRSSASWNGRQQAGAPIQRQAHREIPPPSALSLFIQEVI